MKHRHGGRLIAGAGAKEAAELFLALVLRGCALRSFKTLSPALRSDGSGQTIVAWPDGGNRVMVLLAADVGDAKVAEAAESFAKP
jgi:hypothetical protein